MFKVDYVVQAAGNREFGTVILQNGSQQENVALSVVAAGWAKVRQNISRLTTWRSCRHH